MYIGDYAFRGCSSLTSVTIPGNVTNICYNAFSDCNNVADVYYGGDQVRREQYISSDVLPNAAWHYTGERAGWGMCGDHLYWKYDSSTRTLQIEGSGDMWDYDPNNSYPAPWNNYNGSIIKLELDSDMTSIGDYAFNGCSSLTSVMIPDGVTTIGDSAFNGCNSLKNVTIPEGVTSVCDNAFSGCSSLTSVTISDSVTSIGDFAFQYCSSLTSVTIPDSVTSIGYYAFYSCSSLASITIPLTVSSIGSYAFYGIPVVYFEGTTAQWNAVYQGPYSGLLICLGDPVETAASGTCGEHAVWTLDNKGVLTISGYGKMADYTWDDLPWNSYRSSIMTAVIEEGITSIGSKAFSSCSILTNVTIPSSVTSIGSDAFQNCGSLTSVTIPEGVASIGSFAFSICTSLTSVTIPGSVTSIGDSAFQGCISLESMTILDGVRSIGNGAFIGCSSLTSVTIPASVTSIGYSAFNDCISLESMTILDGVRSMHGVMKRGYIQEMSMTARQCIAVFAGITLYLFTAKMGVIFSRVILGSTAVLHFILGYIIRILWRFYLERTSSQRKKSSMILVADEEVVGQIAASGTSTDEAKIVGVVLTDRDAEGETVAGLPVVANVDNAAKYICREWVDEVFFYPDSLSVAKHTPSTKPSMTDSMIYDNFFNYARKSWKTSDEEEEQPAREQREPVGGVSRLIEQCGQMAIPVHILLPIGAMGGKSFVEKVNGLDVLTHAANYASPLQLLIKRAADLIGSLFGSLAALLIIVVFGPMIKLASPGPILFRQERIGLNGKRFQILKLRTMDADAEERKADLQEQNRVQDGLMFKVDFDPRIIGNQILPDGTQKTGLGEFLRRTSLDEFPQFFNVLFGDMSLVGTRPPTPDEWERYELHHRARLSIRPGITGLWQVSGRSEITDFEEVVRLDTQYINNWSLGLDMNILLKTVWVVFCGRGAI